MSSADVGTHRGPATPESRPHRDAAPALRVPLIQGGMGVGISGWRLARAVSARGQLGVVSGTGLDTLFVRRLQDGDPHGHLRRAMASFPVPSVVDDTLRRWFRPEGRAPSEPYGLLSLDGRGLDPSRQRLIALASYVEVMLAREGHANPVGFNLLTKIPMPNLASLHGAMLAGVDVVLMGAGIPREIPAALDALAEGRPARVRMEVEGMAPADAPFFELAPARIAPDAPRLLKRPAFLPIVASNVLATVLARKSGGGVDGLVIEGPTAGGHNAPPRGEARRNERGEPTYGDRDVVDLSRIADLGLPFWVAGGMGRPGSLERARSAGATGIQVGTLFAFCRESGLDEGLRRQALDLARHGELDVLTDGQASPTGFPFKVVGLPGTLSDDDLYERRSRSCDLGYLRLAYRTGDGGVGFRCPAEPPATWAAKGGAEEATHGRKCLCNALMANAGVPQVAKDGRIERPLVTAGDDVRAIAEVLGTRDDYGATDVIDYLLG